MPVRRPTTKPDAVPLDRPRPRAILWLFLLVVVTPVAVTSLALLATGGLTGPRGPMELVIVATVSMLVFVVLASATMRSELRFGRDVVTVRSGFQAVSVERHAICADHVRVGDRTRDPACMPAARTIGISMPGFHAGWFRTRTAERAFMSLAGPLCVIVPTTLGFVLVLGSRDAHRLAEQLRSWTHPRQQAGRAQRSEHDPPGRAK